MPYHVPVLLQTSIDLLEVKPNGTYVDVTFGGGGHTRELLARLKDGRVVAFDRDPDAARNRIADERLIFVAQDFKFIETMLAREGIETVDGILADLGISSHQIDTPDRGFSFRFDAPLDMRMNPGDELSASQLLQEASSDELLYIFRQYGELPNAKKLTRIICERRKQEKIERTFQLEAIIQDCVPKDRRAKYLAQVYQALRIRINNELVSLEELLKASVKLLKPTGRIAVISYHSLEDRMVKRFFRSGNLEGVLEKDFYGNPLTPWKLITRRAVQASEEEIEANSRARSARLRVVEKK